MGTTSMKMATNALGMLLGFVGATLLISTVSLAQADSSSDNETKAQQEAKRLREEGLNTYEVRGQYANALAKYQESLALQRTAGTMYYIAKALKALRRYDEALFWYEAVLLEFPNASLTLRNEAAEDAADMRERVGIVSIDMGDFDAGVLKGARLFIDKRDLGTLPLVAPAYALPGFHEVRVEFSNFPPISVSVTAIAGRTSIAKLAAKNRIGRLEVREKHNWVMRVEIDGRDMGMTPYAGDIPVGKHRVRLRGFMQPSALLTCDTPHEEVDSGARLESPAQDVTIGLYELKTVDLSVDDLDTSLYVDSVPKMAKLLIDGQEMGKTAWEGRLPLGEHVIEVSAPGFVTAQQRVQLERRKSRAVTVRLNRIPTPVSSRSIGAGAAFGVGALGLGVFAVTGSIAWKTTAQLNDVCIDNLCPGSSEDELIRARGMYPGIIGGAIAASQAQAQQNAAYCSQRYRSYDPASGTYLNRDGNRYPCP